MDRAAYQRDADWCVEYHFACTHWGFTHVEATTFADAMMADTPPGEPLLPEVSDAELGGFFYQLDAFRFDA